MKHCRSLFLIASALVCSVSCQIKLADGREPVVFSVSGGGMAVSADTKSQLFDTETEDNFSFKVFGSWGIKNERAGQDDYWTWATVFNGQQVTATKTENRTALPENLPIYSCTYSPERHWQKTGKYYFRAVMPYASVRTESNSSGMAILIPYSMTAEDYDLMVAASDERNVETQGTAPVHLKFRHALAAVRFMFQKGSRATDVDYRLMSFELRNLVSLGTMTFGKTAEDPELDADLSRKWTLYYNSRPQGLFPWSATVTNGVVTSDIAVPVAWTNFDGAGVGSAINGNGWHFVIPQDVEDYQNGNNPTVYFSSSIRTSNGSGGYNYTTPAFTEIELPTRYRDSNDELQVATLEAGKLYTYIIQIQPGDVTITVNTTDWDTYDVAVDPLEF